MPEIWVYLETEHGAIKKGSLEVLSQAVKTTNASGHTVTALMTAGENQPPADMNIVKRLADRIYLISPLASHEIERTLNQIASMVREFQPVMLFMAATLPAREIAPRLAARLNVPLISDCVDYRLEQEVFTGRRNIMRGKAQATLCCDAASFFIATVCTGIYDVTEPSQSKDAKLIRLFPLQGQAPAAEHLEFIPGDPAKISIKEADTIIAIGRGLESTERLGMVQELAGLLNASIGGTRTAVDMKWLGLERQIGITGETVSPRLFISLGISGQYPHTVGMDASETIIVINKDRDAPMFKLATLGIAGNLENILPVLCRQLKNTIAEEEIKL